MRALRPTAPVIPMVVAVQRKRIVLVPMGNSVLAIMEAAGAARAPPMALPISTKSGATLIGGSAVYSGASVGVQVVAVPVPRGVVVTVGAAARGRVPPCHP